MIQASYSSLLSPIQTLKKTASRSQEIIKASIAKTQADLQDFIIELKNSNLSPTASGNKLNYGQSYYSTYDKS